MWHTALWSCTHIPNMIDLSGQASLRRSRRLAEAEAEEKIRLKQYVSLRSKGRHNYWNQTCLITAKKIIKKTFHHPLPPKKRDIYSVLRHTNKHKKCLIATKTSIDSDLLYRGALYRHWYLILRCPL
jgi:hypothetical protein